MSALGEFEECRTICGCYKCRKETPDDSCNPCLDCTGKHISQLTDKESECGDTGFKYVGEYCEIKERHIKERHSRRVKK